MTEAKLATVFLWLSTCAVASAPPEKKKVVILGAGAAGITAAKTLYDQGVTDFLVLEGQDYIGGRIKHASFAGIKVELGANWIQYADDEDNPLIPLMKKHNLTGQNSNFTNLRVRNDSQAAMDVVNMNVYKDWKKAEHKLFTMGEERGEKDIPPRDMPASTALKMLGWRSDTTLKKALSWFGINFEYGVGEEKTSLNNMATLGDDLFITDQRGMWTLFSDFYSTFQEKILLNKTVSQIKYNNEVVVVTTTEGETFTADYALCTFSSGVLNSGSVKFDPDLPDWKNEAIFRLKPVYYTKIYLKFPSDFWDDAEWILHLSERYTGHFPIFNDLDRLRLFPESTVLSATVTGDESLRVETQEDSKTMKEVMQVLRNMYGSNIPNATEILVSKWSQNPYIRGTWADPVIGTDSSVFANMAGRLNNLFFAGEATHADWYGYMQGGYLSGLERAMEIASCIQGKKCDLYTPSTDLPVIVKTQQCKVSKASGNKVFSVGLLATTVIFIICL